MRPINHSANQPQVEYAGIVVSQSSPAIHVYNNDNGGRHPGRKKLNKPLHCTFYEYMGDTIETTNNHRHRAQIMVLCCLAFDFRAFALRFVYTIEKEVSNPILY